MATAARGRGVSGARSPAQTFALVFGVLYLLVGIVGFAVTGFDEFFGRTFNEKLLIFSLNPAHNIVHILIGLGWLASSRAHQTAKTANLVIGAAYLLVFLLGIFGALEWLAIQDGLPADQWLHLVSGGLSVYFGTAGAEASRARARTA